MRVDTYNLWNGVKKKEDIIDLFYNIFFIVGKMADALGLDIRKLFKPIDEKDPTIN